MTSTTKWRPVRVGQTWRAQNGKNRLVTELHPERNGAPATVKFRDYKDRSVTCTLLSFREWRHAQTAELVEVE